MSHRALVAYRQTDGTFVVRYAHWGRDIAAAVTPATPLGGFTEWPDPAAVADRLDVERRGGADPPVGTRVDPRVLALDVTAEDVLAAVDATLESLVVVSPSYETTTYLVCSLDPSGGATGTGVADGTDGADDTVLARPDGDPESLRSWLVEAKSRLSTAVADGDLTPRSASEGLRRALAARATVCPTDDASFLRDA